MTYTPTRRVCGYCAVVNRPPAVVEIKPQRGTWKFHSIGACAAHESLARAEMEARHGNLTIRPTADHPRYAS